ncbi:aminotransferase [Penicillium chermesinum]|uniref:Aspartate aminotransferase n=1 Tax=Penicillium chermesinum TaxID=63820 RepID=A0A9W9P6D2_9EURO|nr:aminotransferase [Penicillium chermesinum]KAJ5238455.1 aminotransferase [Penicillium chermesinum]KAJ6164113.1 Aspartate [Penicillium chermesinum]
MASIAGASHFSNLEAVPLDPHYALKEAFAGDTDSDKVILGSGIYRDGNSKPWVLPSIEEAERVVDGNKTSARYEYLPISGYETFVTAARDLLFGPVGPRADCFASLQTISGTGANALGAQFLFRSLTPSAVWLSNPSWVNHANIWGLTGVKVKTYPYWDAQRKVLDFEGMIQTLETDAVSGDVIVLHSCAHNPTGVDPTKDQWRRIADICERRALKGYYSRDIDSQGFATGDVDEDAWALRHFVSRGTLELAAAQSFSKNMGLYGERVGALHLLASSPEGAVKAKGHLCRLQRGQISQPPRRGAHLATAILTDQVLFQKWLNDLHEMSSRITSMRQALYEELISLGTPGKWEHIISQIGMFSYTGLTPVQVEAIRAESHVYILNSGRISIAGLTSANVKHVARGIDQAVRRFPA